MKEIINSTIVALVVAGLTNATRPTIITPAAPVTTVAAASTELAATAGSHDAFNPPAVVSESQIHTNSHETSTPSAIASLAPNTTAQATIDMLLGRMDTLEARIRFLEEQTGTVPQPAAKFTAPAFVEPPPGFIPPKKTVTPQPVYYQSYSSCSSGNCGGGPIRRLFGRRR